MRSCLLMISTAPMGEKGPWKDLLISGQHIPAESGQTLTLFDPATQEPLAEVSVTGPPDVKRARRLMLDRILTTESIIHELVLELEARPPVNGSVVRFDSRKERAVQ